MKKEELLMNRLRRYEATDMYPFHMPGHKRLKAEELDFPNPYLVDITEIEGFDNLHHPEGILKDSMEWASSLYGSDRTWYLVNGSTCGLLSAISAAVPHGGKILVSRNCHKAVYHGIYLNHLEAVHIYPQPVPGLGIQGGILPEDVEKSLKEEPDIQAVLIVSPTYDGIVSGVEAIAGIVHKAGLPLIVDEAHGAHFAYGDAFPQSALELGADAVIQSVHKTLPSLTQTALLHVKNNRPDGGCYLDTGKIERYLQIYQSSSPSYVLMASIENGIFIMDQYRKEGKIKAFTEQLKELRRELGKMKCLRLVERTLSGSTGIYDVDISKIVISVRGTGINGETLSQWLREKYHLEMEMCGADYVTAIAAIGDRQEGLDRLKSALFKIDRELEKTGRCEGMENNMESMESSTEKSLEKGPEKESRDSVYSRHAEAVMPIFQAMDSEKEEILLEESKNCISGEFAYIYPPGIPLLAPGERITGKILETLQDYIRKQLPVQGLADHALSRIQVVKNSTRDLKTEKE